MLGGDLACFYKEYSSSNPQSSLLHKLAHRDKSNFQIPIFVGAHEGLVHKFVRPEAAGPPSHGRNGFGDVIFDHPVVDDPDQPVVKEEHAVSAINKLVNQFPGT